MSTTHIFLEQRIRRRDANALAEFIEQRRPQLLAFLNSKLGAGLRRRIDAEDLLQELSVSALRALPDIDLQGRDIFGWLCQQGERRIIDAHRQHVAAAKRSARQEIPLQGGGSAGDGRGLIELLVASITTPSRALSRNQRDDRMQLALSKLSAEARQVLSWRYSDGLSTREIAARIDRSDGATRVFLSRALRQLSELLKDDQLFASFRLRGEK